MTELTNTHLTHFTGLLKSVWQRLEKAHCSNPELLDADILQQLQQIIDLLEQQSGAGYLEGQDWLIDIFNHKPQLAPVIDRELLWFFGGDCLHFLTDDEITHFQHADDQRAEELTGQS